MKQKIKIITNKVGTLVAEENTNVTEHSISLITELKRELLWKSCKFCQFESAHSVNPCIEGAYGSHSDPASFANQ